MGSLVASSACAGAAPNRQPPADDPACAPEYEFAGLHQTILCAERVTVVQTRTAELRAQGALYLPDGEARVGAVVAIIEGGGLGHVAFATGFWRSMCDRFGCALLHVLIDGPEGEGPASDPGRNAALGGDRALEALLDSLAVRTGRGELRDVKLLFWGFSAAGSFGTTYAALHPERTLGFIRYHSHMRGVQIDFSVAGKVPALMIAGGADRTAGTEDARLFWETGRAGGAPWSLAIHPGQPHFSLDAWLRASDLMWHWMEALLAAQSRSPDGVARGEASGWVVDAARGRVLRTTEYQGDLRQTSWFPDSASAEAWRRLVGPSQPD